MSKSMNQLNGNHEYSVNVSLMRVQSYVNVCANRSNTFKVTQKSTITSDGQSPGVYRRISATKDLLREETREVRLRNSGHKSGTGSASGSASANSSTACSTGRLRESATRRSCAQLLAAKMAEVGHSLQTLNGNNWSNNVDDYEVGEIIGQTLNHCHHCTHRYIQLN